MALEIAIVCLIMPFVIMAFVWFYINKKQKKAFIELANYLRGSVSAGRISGRSFTGKYRGLGFSLSLIWGSSSDEALYLEIELCKSSFFKLSIYKESFLSDLKKRIGLVQEIKTNDKKFDARFLIISNAPEQAITYLNKEGIKNAIGELFDSGFNALLIDSKKVMIRKRINYLKSYEEIKPPQIMGIIKKIDLLATGLG